MRKTYKKILTAVFAACLTVSVTVPGILSANAATVKSVLVKDDVTTNTLKGGDWETKENSGISHRWSGGVTANLSGYETGGNNINCFATTTPITFASDEDLMAEYDILGVTSETVHFGVMQGRTLGDSSAWDYNYGYANTFGYYAGADSTSFTFESASADYKFPEVYENGAWVKAQKGNLDLSATSYRIRQIYRSNAVNDETAIEVNLLPVSQDGKYDWSSDSVKRYRASAAQIVGANANGFNNFTIGDGYVGINVEDVGKNEGGGIIIDNVKFSKISSEGTEIKSVIAVCDFESKSLPSNMQLYGLNTDKCLTYTDFSDLEFNQTDKTDLLGSKIKLDVNEKTDLAFKGSFGITMVATADKAFAGVAFGLEKTSEYTSGNIVAGLKITGESAKVAVCVGEKELAASDSFACVYDNYGTTEIKITNVDDDKVLLTVSFDKYSAGAEISRNDVNGYFAIGNFSDSPATFYVDDIDFERYSYAEYAGKTLTENFDDGKAGDDWYYQTSGSQKLSNDDVPDPDYPRYTADAGVKFQNGALRFDRTGDSAMFGPKRSYGDWRFAFDLLQYQYEATKTTKDGIDMWTPASIWFGFSFHKGSYRSTYAASSVYSLMMTRRKTADENKSELTLFGWQIPTFADSVVVPVDAPVDEPLSIRITAVNQTVTVEYKLVKEADGKWKEVVSFGNVDTAGYLSFSSTNWTNFTVDNVSVENLDKYYSAENYPDLKINGDDRTKFDASSPEDVSFGINVGRYEFELLGSKISENDFVVDSVSNTVTIKKEFLSKFPSGTRYFYIRNQFGEEVKVTVDIKNEQKTIDMDDDSGNKNQSSGCGSAVSSSALFGAMTFAAAIFLKKRGGTNEKTEK